jgi:hypothetical protein
MTDFHPVRAGNGSAWRTLFIIAQLVIGAIFALAFFLSPVTFTIALGVTSVALSAAYIALRVA